MHDALYCLQRMLVLSLFIVGWPLSGVVYASDQKPDWIVEVFAKDDNVEVTGALLKYTVKVTNSPTAISTAKKTEIAILIPAGSQLVGALADANCTPLQSELTAKPSTVHVTVTCEVPVLLPGESFECRFHVPCAVLPDRIGTNYSLKLDTNSLPTGYRVTTENPRVVRLTRGKISKLNFGAAIAKLVRLDVNRKAFVRSETAPTRLSKILEQTLNELARKYQKTPLHLRVVYHVDTAAGPLKTRIASQDIKHLKRQIRRIWQRNQNAKLTLETTIFN